MPNTYTSLICHVVFSTKNRKRTITPDIRQSLFAYMAGILRRIKCQPILINGPDDHAHVLTGILPSLSVAECVGKVKANSSSWVNQSEPNRARFSWQDGYAAFSVSPTDMNDLHRYIADQEEHHRRVSFQEELLSLLKAHQIEYDERFLWD